VWGESADLLLTACKARPLTQCGDALHPSPDSLDYLQVPMSTVNYHMNDARLATALGRLETSAV
jgi:hypothetical protein